MIQYFGAFLLEGGPDGTNLKLDYLPDSVLQNHDFVRVGYRGVDSSVSLNLKATFKGRVGEFIPTCKKRKVESVYSENSGFISIILPM